MKILIILPGFIPSTIIAILRPLAALERMGEVNLRLRLYNISYRLLHDIAWCDVAVFCRNTEIKDLEALYELKRQRKKIIYEIDDNFEEIPLNTDIGVYHRAFYRLHVLKRFFVLSDITRVYSERLKQRAIAHGARVQVIRSYFDTSIIEGLAIRKPDGIVRIAYPTGRIDDKELEECIFSAVKVVLEKHVGKVEFHLWRKSIPKQLTRVEGVVLNRAHRNYEQFIRAFFLAGFDIGLAPGIDTPFFRSKTNNKYREFGGCGIAGIYSDFPPYSDSVIHEYSGLLVGSSITDWISAIERLVSDTYLRSVIVKNAAEDICRNYTFYEAMDSWRKSLGLLDEQKSFLPNWLPPKDKLPVFAFVHLNHEKMPDRKSDYRLDCIFRASEGVPGMYLEQFYAVNYLRSHFRKISCASIFLLDHEHELEVLTQLIPMTTSAIIDVTSYKGNLADAISRLQNFLSVIPISILLSIEQASSMGPKKSVQDCLSFVNIQLLPLDQDFSLSGFPAVYLDLFERHIRYAPIKRSTKYFHLKNMISSLRTYYYCWKGRLETVVIFIKWRFKITGL